MVTLDISSDLANRIAQFRRDRPSLEQATFNEASCRLQFLDPLFVALGWDVNNTQGLAERFKEVQLEPSQEFEEGRKGKPDYSFRVGGVPVFFAEAKKPSVSIAGNKEAAHQIRRYCWSRQLPVGLLTNFAEYAIYDCRARSKPSERPTTRRLAYWTIDEFEDNWDLLVTVFARDSIVRGGMDRWVEEAPARGGTQPVDKAFLADIERWRDVLARNLALRNPKLTQRDLNHAVTATIDRIVFLRICEDRHIENPNTLHDTTVGKGIYPSLCDVFRLADKKYNSGLFHFEDEKGRPEEPDLVSLTLRVDDDVLGPIIKGLYPPVSPYAFSVIPADILGQVYEQFLGKVITLSSRRTVKIEEKAEVKKAGGIVYTPTWVVQAIAEKTLTPLFEGQTVGKVSGARPIRVLDPACGSGTFLIAAYEWILAWYLDAYSSESDRWSKGNNPRIISRQNTWRLSTNERKRILITHIFGVDIDAQAVEVTKLSLLLKVLEGETQESIQQEFAFALERALPDLDGNIRCGNSLIGTNFYVNQQLSLTDDEEFRVNAFDWKTSFAGDGKFDAVIGNPPYVRIQHLQEWAPLEAEYLKNTYETASERNFDLYVPFIEKSLQLLSKRGRLGFIVSSKWMKADYGDRLRSLLSKGKHVEQIVHFGDEQVFDRRTTYTCLLYLTTGSNGTAHIIKVHNLDQWRATQAAESGDLTAGELTDDDWNLPIGPAGELYKKLAALPTSLADVTTGMNQGLITGADPVYLFERERPSSDNRYRRVFSVMAGQWLDIESDLLKPVVRSGEQSVAPYRAVPSAWLLFPYDIDDGVATLYSSSEMRARFPNAWDYLKKCRFVLRARDRGSFTGPDFYQFARSQNLAKWDQEKLLVPYMIRRLSAYHDANENLAFVNVATGGYAVTTAELDYRYLCGLLNSDLGTFFLRFVSEPFQGGYVAANKQYLEQVPVVVPDLATTAGRQLHDEVCRLVDQAQEAYRRARTAQSRQGRRIQLGKAEAFASRVSELINTIYGYSSEDIALATAPYVPALDDESIASAPGALLVAEEQS